MNGGTRRGFARFHPGIPNLVHFTPGIHIGEPHKCANDFGFICTCFSQKTIDLIQNFLRLHADRLAGYPEERSELI